MLDTDSRLGSARPGLKRWLPLVGLLTLSLGALLVAAWQARHPVGNVDSVSYLSIARQYAAGDFGSAVNAYWSPMVSWLTAVFIRIGVPEVLGFLLVNALAAMCGIAMGAVVVARRTRDQLWPTAMFIVSSTVFFVAVVYLLTPDVLAAAWVIIFVAALEHLATALEQPDRRAMIRAAVGLGVLSALGYFTKAYLVPVVLVSTLIWALVARAQLRSGGPGPETGARVWRAVGIAGLCAVLVSAPWVGALTAKYGQFTTGSSFVVNMEAKFEPEPASGVAGEVAEVDLVLWAPPNDGAVSFGEDRTNQASDRPFASETPVVERIVYYAEQRIEAFPHYMGRIGSLAPLAPASTAALLIGVVLAGRVPGRLRLPVAAAIVWSVYFLGYAAITTAANAGGNTRYYWPLLTIWLLGVAVAAPVAWDGVRQRQRSARGLVIGLVLLIPLSVLWQFGLSRSAPFTTSPGPRGIAAAMREAPPTAAQGLARDHLVSVIPRNARIVASNYRASVMIAYELGAQAYGRADQGYDVDDPAFRELLREHGIDYYLYFQPAAQEAGLPEGIAKLGPTVATVVADIGCSDLKGTPIEPCQIDVVAVDSGN